ncbi:hypothetical protein [Flavobacterium sp.]|uniref:hypothetical protein n=1 Tax=Flavobacterium sp. TaxID=239 RepID=UPI0037506662
MKKSTLVILSLISLISCNKKEISSENKFETFVNCDISGDYKTYLNLLSEDYKKLLLKKYKTTNENVLFDSIINFKNEFHNKIKNGEIKQENIFVKEVTTDLKNVSIIKYRSVIIDLSNKNEMFKEKIILNKIENGIHKFIPYEIKFNQNIDSLILGNYSNEILDKIKNLSKFQQFDSDDKIFVAVKKRYLDYVKTFESSNDSLLNFIYPKAIQIITKESSLKNISKQNKKLILENIKQSKKIQELNFDQYFIDNFKKIETNEKQLYRLDYAISVGNNIYIPGKLIVIFDNNKIYFLEYDKDEFQSTLSNLYNKNTMVCIQKAFRN